MCDVTFERCLKNIFTDIEKRRSVDYADRNSVRRYNAASDRIYKNFAYIDEHFPDRIESLMEYVDADNLERIWFFVFGITKMKNSSKEQKVRCVEELRKLRDNTNLGSVERDFALPWNLEVLEKEIYNW